MDEKPDPKRVRGENAPVAFPLVALALGLASGVAALVVHARGADSPNVVAPTDGTSIFLSAAGNVAPERAPDPPDPLDEASLARTSERSLASTAPRPPERELSPSPCRGPLLVTFDYASGELNESARREVRRFARWAAEREGRVVVRGHTDRHGSSSHNLALSRRRAQAVAAVLRARGVAEERLLIQAFGEYQPLGRSAARDRRVEVHIEAEDCASGAGT